MPIEGFVRGFYIERGTAVPLAELLNRTGWDHAVIKPCVSGAARHTYRINRTNAAAIDATIRPLVAEESFLLQPFQESIIQTGEDSLIVISGRYSHAVRKVATRAACSRRSTQREHIGSVAL